MKAENLEYELITFQNMRIWKHLDIYRSYNPVTLNYLRLCYIDFQFSPALQTQHISSKTGILYLEIYIKKDMSRAFCFFKKAFSI